MVCTPQEIRLYDEFRTNQVVGLCTPGKSAAEVFLFFRDLGYHDVRRWQGALAIEYSACPARLHLFQGRGRPCHPHGADQGQRRVLLCRREDILIERDVRLRFVEDGLFEDGKDHLESGRQQNGIDVIEYGTISEPHTLSLHGSQVSLDDQAAGDDPLREVVVGDGELPMG